MFPIGFFRQLGSTLDDQPWAQLSSILDGVELGVDIIFGSRLQKDKWKLYWFSVSGNQRVSKQQNKAKNTSYFM